MPFRPAKIAGVDFSVEARGELQSLAPLPYLDFLALQTRATVLITDSGGIQEETTVLGVPCLTVRENTERPSPWSRRPTSWWGWDLARLRSDVELILKGHRKVARMPPLWDGHAAERVAPIVQKSVA